MIDLILALFAGGMYVAGWKSHAKWGTLENMAKAARAKLAGWFQ